MSTVTTYLNIIPLRAEPSHRSEMVSQILFGEQLQLLEEQGDFSKVRMQDIGYEGWAQRSQLHEYAPPMNKTNLIVGLEEVFLHNGVTQTRLYPGTPIRQNSLMVGRSRLGIKGDFRQPNLDDFKAQFVKVISSYLRTPYLWGGRSICGIDCSGFSQAVYAHFGVILKRDAYQQAEGGKVVDFLTEIKAGDLAFFDDDEGRITHVGIMIDPGMIVHASGEVRIDKMDQQGIYRWDNGVRSHKLRIVKRYF